jgi:ribose/xylose/arabinose/galactoside ABC-type transport system permease subunit
MNDSTDAASPITMNPGSAASRRPTRKVAGRIALVVLLVACAAFVGTTPGFATIGTVRSVLLASAFVAMVAVGQSVIAVSGNFLSMALGTQVAACALIFLGSLQWGLIAAIAIALISGVLMSAVQGYALGVFGANPIVLTIGASVIIEGAIVLVTGGATVTNSTGVAIDFLSNPVAGVAPPVFAMVLVVAAVELYLRRTRQGASSYLVGSNRAAARAAGLPETRITVTAFAIAGTCCGVAGVMLGGFQGSGSLSLAGTLTFDSIAAVLVAGIAVAGGRGSAIAAALGAIGISLINSALLLRGVPLGTQILVKGVVVLVAVIVVRLLSSRRTR